MDDPGKAARRRFLDDRVAAVAARGLMAYPAESAEEHREILAFARLWDVLDAPVVIRHPHFDLRLELPLILGPRLAYLIAIGDYELTDLQLIAAHVEAGDRVMELGGGAGVTAALAAKISGAPIVVAEADARLFGTIRANVEGNGGAVSFEHGVVTAGGGRGDGTIDFYLDADPWISSTSPEAQGRADAPARRKITAPVLGLDELLAKHRPTVLTIDIEGGERELLRAPFAHPPRLVLVEIHTPHFGERAGAQTAQALIDHGYRLIDQRGWTYAFLATEE
jgi:FkbM family methyltransferase